MNLRQFTLAMLISALPLGASSTNISLNAGDSVAGRGISQEGEVRVKLSKSGKAKLKKLRKESPVEV